MAKKKKKTSGRAGKYLPLALGAVALVIAVNFLSNGKLLELTGIREYSGDAVQAVSSSWKSIRGTGAETKSAHEPVSREDRAQLKELLDKVTE